MKHLARAIATLALLAPASAPAATADEVFAEGEHCVAYRTVKGMFFRFDVEVVGKSCQVSAALFPGDADSGARVAVEVPIESFRSGNFLRDGSVRDLLGAEEQPAVYFVSAPLEVAALRQWISDGRIPLSGVLTVGGRDVPVVFDLELFGHGDLHFVRGSLETTFSAFDIEVPTVGPGGMIAAPGETLELVLQLELERVEGIEQWARENQLR